MCDIVQPSPANRISLISVPESVVGRKNRLNDMVIEMNDHRCKVAAIEAEDRRCLSLLNRVVIGMEDPRCRIVAIEMEDPRCKNLNMMW